MEYRPRPKQEVYNEIIKICKQMLCIGITITLAGVLGIVIFHYTGKYFIHPAIYLFLIPMGLSLIFTGLYAVINTKIKYGNIGVNNDMSKTEALKAMNEGKKITHEYFGSSEFLFIDCGIIRTEEGYNFDDGWDERIGPEWERGWKIYGVTQLCK